MRDNIHYGSVMACMMQVNLLNTTFTCKKQPSAPVGPPKFTISTSGLIAAAVSIPVTMLVCVALVRPALTDFPQRQFCLAWSGHAVLVLEPSVMPAGGICCRAMSSMQIQTLPDACMLHLLCQS